MIPKVFDYNKLFIDFTTKVFGVTKKKYGNKPVFFFFEKSFEVFYRYRIYKYAVPTVPLISLRFDFSLIPESRIISICLQDVSCQ